MTDLIFKSATDLGQMLKARKISARELLQACLDQFAKHNEALNAIVVTDIPQAMKAAAAADKRLDAGEPLSPIDGVPMTAKESFNWTGTPTTFGDPAFADNIATSDSDAIKRLTGAGAVLYGKTNVPLDLSDWQSSNAVYGTTNNPWKLSRTPGGSSGGAAAALATGMSAIEVGSDIGASIRNPAHYCGVYGHKPTYQLVSYKGHGLPGSVSTADITVAGPLARSAKDLSVLLGILAGPPEPEARAYKVSLPKPEQKSLKDFRVAVKLTSPVTDVDHQVQDKIAKLAATLEKRVARLSMTAAPDFSDEENYQIFITLLRSTASKKLSDVQYFDAVARAKQLSNSDRSYVAMMTRAFALSHRDWLRVHDRRNQMRLAWDAFFEDWDVMLCPVAASTAFVQNYKGERHERLIPVNGKQQSVIDQRFWAGYSGGYYLPSTVAPLGLAEDGLPVGVQIITREYDDLKAIRFAELLEKDFGGFIAPPGY
ncbi:amidase [Aestuariivirga litoralis]|uniref:amidase n=1 Tax=Aestuariivirga litoralis TaxID=2650924 RepID=UPI0018C814BB|nr:amidase [Aestuariivirga litoralis]MBG1232271.1 amidase [Aestuariivirga litoralis]